MKVLLSWIFDHIGAEVKAIDVEQLVYRFNQTTAEIEHWMPVELPLDELFIARVTASDPKSITLECPELSTQITAPYRTDAILDQWFLIKKEGNFYQWASSANFYHSKQFLLPALTLSADLRDGSWKKQVPERDYILDVDNKSITHRPDLWCHRGIAREIAAFLQLPLLPLETLLVDLPHKEEMAEISSKDGISLAIYDPLACKRLAAVYVPTIENKPSLLPQAIRLLLVDGKPINAIVDATNYVMFDIGQPMHAFDASKIADKKLTARRGSAGEILTLLDGTAIELTPQDLVIADAQKPVALAGIMGGSQQALV